MERFFHGPQAAVRPYLLIRIVPCMLALDIWMLMIGHAGRYGAAGFNVAHFVWLDRVLPVPTAGGYIALLLFAGAVAIYVALTGIQRFTTIALCICYTLSWAISMLDSYQHHYFVSLVLVCLAGFPNPKAHAPPGKAEAGVKTSGFGYPLLACTIGILYVFAALAKCDESWTDGHTIRRISQADALLAPVMDMAQARGWSPAQLWSWLSTSVIPVELALGVGYLIACQQDRVDALWVRVVSAVTAVLALSLHLGAEALSLEIGWFSYYMLVFAAVYLLPARGLHLLASPWMRLERAIETLVADVEREVAQDGGRGTTFFMALGISAMWWFVSYSINLPGAQVAGGALAASLLVWTLLAIVRGEAGRATRPILASGTVAIAMWLAIIQSDVRWDFYRYLGGDLARRGEPRAALDAYITGEHYAPPGESRQSKIDRLRNQLGQKP